MDQTLENPEFLKEFCDQSTKRGPWDSTRISGHPGGGLQNPPFPDSDNPTSRHGRSLASYKGSARSTDELKQSSSFDSACGATTSTSNGFRERQDFTSTIPTTPSGASFGNETYLARKSHDLDLSGSKSEDCEGSLAEEVQSVGGRWHQRILEGLAREHDRSVQPETGSQELGHAKVFEEVAGGHDRSLQPETWSQDPVNPRPLGWTAAKQDNSRQLRNLGREPLYQRLLRWAGREHKHPLQPEAPGRGRLRRAARSVWNFLVHQDVISSATAVFNRDIQIADHKCKYILASALLDTQCQRGNWISKRLVERLGRQHEISQDYNPPDVLDANGHPVVACGIISLQWKWSPRGTRVHECSFLVFPESDHLDVIFGAEYLWSRGLVSVNESAMTPMTAHNKATTAEKAAIAAAHEKQKQGKAALEARRIQKQQAGQQHGAQSSQAQQTGSQNPSQNQGRPTS
ncbi:MAG: hypothetical protein L6R38_009711 [Xanthoria sp. 2 TBL-2021]|nr:MAG: hypothetical protein L6R38_009711 [Xanthoria sp. 2 TBL-2021]